MSRPDILEAGERLESLTEKLAHMGVIVDGPWEWLENTGYVFGPISHKKSSSYLWGKVSIPGLRQRSDRKEREGKTLYPFWMAHQEGFRTEFSMNPKQKSVLLLEAGNVAGSRTASDHPSSGDEQWKRRPQECETDSHQTGP